MLLLPAPLRLTPSFPFVGRSRELATLRALLPRAEGEGRRVALVGGEPGSGKSRLVREFAHEIAADGALVLYGACDAVVRTPYRPFVEALDQLARVTDPALLRSDLGPTGGELVRLLPELPMRVGKLPAPVAADPDTVRHRLHTALTDLLAGVSRRQPVLLVLEDGHWADAPTLLLLRHLARAAADARVLLLATFRDTEADVPEELSEALADLRRAEDVVRLSLGGLSIDDVAEFVRRAAGGADLDADLPELARAISDLTEGNAFLLCELWRTLVETGALAVVSGTVRLTRPLAGLGSPESVREVVNQRLSRLAATTNDLLELAAVAGPEFELTIVRDAAGLAEHELAAALEEAVQSGTIEEAPARQLAYRFTHELVRRALYDRLSGLRRAELHLRVAEALEHAYGTGSGQALADLAHHFAAAAPFGGRERGVLYNVRAAQAAMAALAFGEAADRLRAALELGIEDAAERASVYMELGNAFHRGGKSVDALHAFSAVATIARELDDAELLAQAAIGYEDACWRPGIADEAAVELLEEAAAALDEGDSPLRVGVLGGLARALWRFGYTDRGAVVQQDAIGMARRLRDREGLATVLMRSYWSRGASSLREILDMLTEAKRLGGQLRSIEIQAEASSWHVPTFIALCDLESARREVGALLETAEKTAQPFLFHVALHYASTIALCDGRLAEAEALAERSHEWSRLLTGRDASGVYGIQMFSIRREQGRLAELAPAMRILAHGASHGGAWRPGLVALLAELGLEGEARRELARLAEEGLEPFRESLWLASLAYLTDACAVLRDEQVALLLYPELEPHSGGNVMIGHGVACYGAADRYLGMLAAIVGDWDRAEQHFEAALELNRRMGARTWLAHTAYEYGRMLDARGERDRAGSLLAEAGALAKQTGMPALLSRVDRLHSTAVARARLPDGLSAREVQILGLVARGLSNREIGKELFISEHTAANHIRSILRKTGCSNRTEAASYAHRYGLVNTGTAR
jgi:DNA-binding CsgD family transcriptional regulator